MDLPKLIVICGPTASGKTKLAVEAALAFGGEVVSADSMQVYRGMDIGTAKPTAEERRGIAHHMIDCVDINEEYSAALFQRQARRCIAAIAARGNVPILCGGTGLYINAVVYPLGFGAEKGNPVKRAELLEFAQTHGNEALHDRLAALVPEAAARIHSNNVRRVIRALEAAEAAGEAGEAAPQALFNGEPLYDLAWVGLMMPRDALYRRIDARVDEMLRAGLLDEVARLGARYPRQSTAFQGLGYKELFDCIDGRVGLSEAAETVKRRTRNYAKRQLTWFRREQRVRWFDVSAYPDGSALTADIFGYLRGRLHMSDTAGGGGGHE